MRYLQWNEKDERTFYLEVLRGYWKERKFKPYYVKKRTHKKYKRYLNLDITLFAEKFGKSTNFFLVRPVRAFPVTRHGLLKHPYYVDNWGKQTFAKPTKWGKLESFYRACISIPPSEVTTGNMARDKVETIFNDFRMAIFYQPTPSHERELALGGKYVK